MPRYTSSRNARKGTTAANQTMPPPKNRNRNLRFKPVKCFAIRSLNRKRSSGCRTGSRRPSEATRDPWQSSFKNWFCCSATSASLRCASEPRQPLLARSYGSLGQLQKGNEGRHLLGTGGCALIESVQSPDGAEGPNVGKAEREAKTVLLVNSGGKGVSRIFESDAAAIPVVGRLYGRRLHIMHAAIHSHSYRAAQPPHGDVAILHQGAVLVVNAEAERRLTSDGGGQRGLSHIRLPTRHVPLAAVADPSARYEGAGIQLMQYRIIIHRPLNIASCILHPETGDDGRKAARRRKKRNAGEIYGAVEHVTLAGYQRSAKSGIEEILLRQLPSDDFARRTLLVIASTGIVFVAGLFGCESFLLGKKRIFRMVKAFGRRLRFLGEQPVDHPIFHFVGVGQNVALVETEDLAEVVDARLVAIDNLRLDGVLYHVAKEFAIEDLG